MCAKTRALPFVIIMTRFRFPLPSSGRFAKFRIERESTYFDRNDGAADSQRVRTGVHSHGHNHARGGSGGRGGGGDPTMMQVNPTFDTSYDEEHYYKDMYTQYLMSGGDLDPTRYMARVMQEEYEQEQYNTLVSQAQNIEDLHQDGGSNRAGRSGAGSAAAASMPPGDATADAAPGGAADGFALRQSARSDGLQGYEAQLAAVRRQSQAAHVAAKNEAAAAVLNTGDAAIERELQVELARMQRESEAQNTREAKDRAQLAAGQLAVEEELEKVRLEQEAQDRDDTNRKVTLE